MSEAFAEELDESIDEYLVRYERNATSALETQIRDTKNFFIKVENYCCLRRSIPTINLIGLAGLPSLE